jgi:hypothetical protein
MTLEQIDRLIRQANPVPDLGALEPIDASVLDEQRRMDMQTHDRVVVDREPGPSRRNWIIGIAAAAAVVVGALLVFQLRSDAPVAGQPRTAVQIATDYLAAVAARDPDGVASLVSAEALADLGSMEALRAEFQWREASGFELLPGSCEEANSTPTEVFVECAYDYHGIRSAELGLGPYTGSTYMFTIRDQDIVVVRDLIVYTSNGFAREVWEPFAEWVSQTYPDDLAVMYTPGYTDFQLTEESIALWEQRSREYVEFVNGS